MSLSSSDLDRVADDIFKDRRIPNSVHCGNCGYNLRTLPYIYSCPECGGEYNARPLSMKGIFAPQNTDIPFGDFASAFFCALCAYVIVRGAFEPLDVFRLAMGGAFAACSVVFVRRTCRQILVFWKARKVARRIAMEEDA